MSSRHAVLPVPTCKHYTSDPPPLSEYYSLGSSAFMVRCGTIITEDSRLLISTRGSGRVFFFSFSLSRSVCFVFPMSVVWLPHSFVPDTQFSGPRAVACHHRVWQTHTHSHTHIHAGESSMGECCFCLAYDTRTALMVFLVYLCDLERVVLYYNAMTFQLNLRKISISLLLLLFKYVS